MSPSIKPEDDAAPPSNDVEQVKQELERIKNKYVLLAQRVVERGRRTQEILNSTSCRITAPVRVIVNAIRRTSKFISRRATKARRNYQNWIRLHSSLTPAIRDALIANVKTLPTQPIISIIMPFYNINLKWASEAIESIRNQIYPYWELCISDDASTTDGVRDLFERFSTQDSRIRITFRDKNGHISANSNSAMDLATGDYIALMDADDLLPEDALFWVAHEIAAHPEVDLLFSDEDKIDEFGQRSDPYFKTAWNPALMLAQNAFCHFGVYRRSLVEQVGRFRVGYEGAQDHDLVLRCAAKTSADRIRHIPRILYHWRVRPGSTASSAAVKPYAWNAGARAIKDFLNAQGIMASVARACSNFYQVAYEIPQTLPLVSIIVATTLKSDLVVSCLRSVLEKSTYKNFELLILSTNEQLSSARENPSAAALLVDPRVRTIQYETPSFNYSWVNNLGASSARGEFLCFLNDDVEVITKDWLEQLAARVQLENVGAVGPMLYYPSDRIQHAGVILGIGGVADHAFRGLKRGQGGYFSRSGLEQDYSCLTAACLLVRRKIFEAIGGFDVELPVAFNDVNLSILIRRTGARLIWTPAVEMYHHESLTLGRHTAPSRAQQFKSDLKHMRARWGELLDNDPYYNPNLSLDSASQFILSPQPRVPNPLLEASDRIAEERNSRTCELI